MIGDSEPKRRLMTVMCPSSGGANPGAVARLTQAAVHGRIVLLWIKGVSGGVLSCSIP